MRAYSDILLAMALTVTGAQAGEPRSEALKPVTPVMGLNPEKVELGRWIFHDHSLSDSGRIACSTCHDLRRGGSDRQAVATDSRGLKRHRNTPTVFNAALNALLHWDGAHTSLEQEALAGIRAPDTLNTPIPAFLQRLRSNPRYRERFEALYADGVNEANLGDAIAAFEYSLVTPDSDFDRYLKGDDDALSPEAREGYRLFKQYGCTSCHQGVAAGGNLFARIGIVTPMAADDPAFRDPGRFARSGREQDRHVFRVPGLRNVAATPPYLHDGSIATLDDTIRLMGIYQLGRRIPPLHRAHIERFLHSLTGRYQGRLLATPSP